MRRSSLAGLITIVLCLVSIETTRTQTPATTLTLLSREGRRSLATTAIGNQDYVSVDDLNAAFGTTAREDRLAGGLTITVRNRSAVLTADQTVVQASGRLVSLLAPVLRRDGRWLVPVDFIPRALSLILETRLDLRRNSRLLVMGDMRVPRVVVAIDAGVSNVSVVFEVTPSAEAKVSAQPGRLVVQFDADALELTLPPIPAQTFLLGVAQAETPGAIAIVTGPRYAQFRTSASQADAGSNRFVVDLLPTTTAATAPSATAPAPDNRPSLNANPVQGLRTLVIDPGHGGEELGAQGPRGTLEKEITLTVARRLRTLVESRLGLKVFLTREDDRTVPLDDRSAFANAHKADVFLSIHANAAVRPSLKGAEVYYLTVERADAEARKRADDSATALPEPGGGTRMIDLILWETAQARYLEQSSSLAGLIEQSLGARLEMSPRAVRQAPFRVLVGANMPAALVEMGYLTNADQETQLTSAEYQDHVVQAILEALIKFRDLLDSRASVNPQHRKYALIAGVAVVVIALSWGMFAALGWLLRRPVPGSGAPVVPAVTAPPAGNPAAPHINATLYFASEDGQRLVSSQQEVPLGGSTVEQARSILEAQFAAKPPEPLTSTIPEGAAVRGIYVSSQNDVFVDLDPAVRTKHPGGSMQELLTVYTIVNALLTNLPTLQQVQILIDGREADTLAGHVDLRRPLKKNDSLLATPP